jgi:hypothetical protein
VTPTPIGPPRVRRNRLVDLFALETEAVLSKSASGGVVLPEGLYAALRNIHGTPGARAGLPWICLLLVQASLVYALNAALVSKFSTQAAHAAPVERSVAFVLDDDHGTVCGGGGCGHFVLAVSDPTDPPQGVTIASRDGSVMQLRCVLTSDGSTNDMLLEGDEVRRLWIELCPLDNVRTAAEQGAR